MKKLKLFLCIVAGMTITFASPAQSCSEWVKLPDYNMGTWGDGTIWGTFPHHPKIGGSEEIYSRSKLYEKLESFFWQCESTATTANFHASQKYPEQMREIQIFFTKELRNCQKSFQNSYNNLTGKLCNQD